MAGAASRESSSLSHPRPDRLRASLHAALPGWFAARLLVLVALILAYAIAKLFIRGACDEAACFDPASTSFWTMIGGRDLGLMSWDAEWYRGIAATGYEAMPPEAVRYFPLFPLLGRGLGRLFGSDGIGLLLVANASALVLGMLVHRLCILEGRDASIARRASWLVALAPPAFVLVMAYSEALAMSLAVGAFLAVRTRRWLPAAMAGFLAGMLRPTGILLMVPFAIEGMRGFGAAPVKERALRIAAFASPLAGAGAYLLWAGRVFGDPLLPLRVQQEASGRGPLSNPVATLYRTAVSAVADGRVDLVLHLLWVLMLAGLVVVTFRRWPVCYGAFALVNLLQAIGTSNLNSLERYGFAAFPLLLSAAAWAGPDELKERVVLVLSGAAMTAYATAAFLSGYVP